MNAQLNPYQLTYLLSSLLDKKGAAEIRQKIKEMIEKQKGQIGEEKIMNNDLAYPIKKQEQAVFLNLSFQSLPESIEELKKQLELENHILRYMIQKKTLRTSKKRWSKPLLALSETKLESKRLEAEPQKEKVKLEELDKKLEEILNQ